MGRVSEIKFKIPRIDSIPIQLFELHNYDEAFILLGFKPSGFTYRRIFSNSKEEIEVSISNNGFQWIFQIPSIVIKNRSFLAPHEISIQENLTPIEILAVLSREWKKIFIRVDIPHDLNYGYLYSEHIRSLKLSRPSNPYIIIERDILRFTINKIKKEFIDLDLNEIIRFSIKNEMLIINSGTKNFPIPVLRSENFNKEKISVLFGDFINMVPKRFSNETVHLNMTRNGLLIDNHLIRANWDGVNIWEFDEYDQFLSNRLINREILFEG